MEPSAINADPPEVAATRTLQFLHAQADGVRLDLANLRQELIKAREELRGLRSAQLKEADEQLVLAAVHADTVAQTAVSSLDELTHHSQHDELTGAATRTLMLDRLQNAIALAQRQETRVGVLFVDLDHFKKINDTLGHAVGDEVLKLVTVRLQSAVRDSDTVSRHSGDEFLVLLAGLSSAADATPVARQMLAALRAPARIGPHTLHLTASVGIAIYPEDGADPGTLIQRADAAMYRAKRSGAGAFEFHVGTKTTEAATPASADTARHVPTRSDVALARHEARLRELSDANHGLLLAAQVAQKLKAHAEEAHQRQITFVAKAAHAMRTPLSVILMTARTIPHADAAGLKHQEVISRHAMHLARLIEDLLEGSLVGGGEFKLDCVPLDINAVVNVAVDACRSAIDSMRQRLHLEPSPQKAMVHGDPMRLAQVFSNLLNHAARQNSEDGDVWVSVELDDGDARVTVCDNGAGISPEALPGVFDLFALDPHAAVGEPGLGIGLAVAKELVKAHGGSIEASSAGKGHGSKFVVRLPRIG